MTKVRSSFAQTGDVIDEFQYLFDEGEEGICGKSLQYILKWIDTVRLAQKYKEKGKGGTGSTEHHRGRGNTTGIRDIAEWLRAERTPTRAREVNPQE